MAVLAPIPSASVSTTTAVKAGALRSARAAYFTSCAEPAGQRNPVAGSAAAHVVEQRAPDLRPVPLARRRGAVLLGARREFLAQIAEHGVAIVAQQRPRHRGAPRAAGSGITIASSGGRARSPFHIRSRRSRDWRSAAAPAGLQREVTLRAAAALRRRIRHARAHVAFALEPGERGIERADRDGAPGAFLDFLPDRDAVGVVTEMHDRQQQGLFEFAERVVRHAYLYFKVVVIANASRRTDTHTLGDAASSILPFPVPGMIAAGRSPQEHLIRGVVTFALIPVPSPSRKSQTPASPPPALRTPGEHPAEIRAVIAIVEQADVPASAELVEELHQGARPFRKLEAGIVVRCRRRRCGRRPCVARAASRPRCR